MGSSEEVVDLSNVPLKPLGKREIQQLEIALITGTLYRPEVLGSLGILRRGLPGWIA